MSRESDANEVAARVVRDATAKHEQPLPLDVEKAWERGQSLLGPRTTW